MRSASASRYLGDDSTIAAIRLRLADHFLARPADDPRMAEEAPYQLREAGALGVYRRYSPTLSASTPFLTAALSSSAYWRALGAIGAAAESDLPKALEAKAPDCESWNEPTASLALAIANFLLMRARAGTPLKHYSSTVCELASTFWRGQSTHLASHKPPCRTFAVPRAFDEAQTLDEDLVAKSRATLGAEHIDTLVYVNNLALVLLAKGDYAAALAHFERVLEIERRILKAEDKALLITINNVAICKRALGDYSGALALQEEDVSARERRFGRESPEAASAYYNLATTTELMGDAKGAMQRNRQALHIREKMLGPTHPDTLASKHAVARAMMRAGDPEGARPLQEEVFSTFTQIYGPDHTDTLMAKGNLGSTLQRLGETEIARAMLEDVANKREQSLGRNTPTRSWPKHARQHAWRR